MLHWLRNNVYAAGMLLVLRLYLGYEWITGGWHKLTSDTPFTAQKFLENAVNKPVLVTGSKTDLMYPTFTAFVQNFALPNVDLFNFIVPWGEFLIGLGLILGTLTTAAQFFGLLMNFMYMFAGTVSSNPWMVLLGTIIFIAGANAGRFGGDRWVLPYIRRFAKKILHLEADVTIGTKHKAV